jgi:hypothetical protein
LPGVDFFLVLTPQLFALFDALLSHVVELCLKSLLRSDHLLCLVVQLLHPLLLQLGSPFVLFLCTHQS